MSLSFLLTSLIVLSRPAQGAFHARDRLDAGMAGEHRAWQAPREEGAPAVETRLDAHSGRRVILTGFLINILNPKLSIFLLAFLPQFIAADEVHPLGRMLELSVVSMAMTFVVFALYGLFASLVRDHGVSRPRIMTWLRRAFALLGARLAFAES